MLDYLKGRSQDDPEQGNPRGSPADKHGTIKLASQSMESIMNGTRCGERVARREDMRAGEQRPEPTSGAELDGLSLPNRLLVKNQEQVPINEEPLNATAYDCPGSVIRIAVDHKNPLVFDMPSEAYAYSQDGQAFRATRAVANYAKGDLLASGWISCEQAVLGRSILIDAPYPRGRVAVFGLRPPFRGQTFGTFKFVLTAMYLGSAKVL